MAEPPSQLYRETTIDGKGIGLVATTTIPKGTIIIDEQPWFIYEQVAGCSSDEFNKLILSNVARLSKANRLAFLNLFNAFEGETLPPFIGIVTTNSYGLGYDGRVLGVFEKSSRMNHSCHPNANHNWIPTRGIMETRAIVDIAAGEEIVISYLFPKDRFLNHRSRRIELAKYYKFYCECLVCSLPAVEVAESNYRRARIMEIDTILDETGVCLIEPAKALLYCMEALRLIEEEGFFLEVPRVYHDCFQIHIAHGDLARAKAFMKLKMGYRAKHEGDYSPEVEKDRPFAEKPKRHNMYRYVSNQWRTKPGYALEEGTPGFKQWLWKRSEGWFGIPV